MINASRHGCVPDTERIYSRVDMVVLDLEVDKNALQHSDYTIACELSRMSDINTPTLEAELVSSADLLVAI